MRGIFYRDREFTEDQQDAHLNIAESAQRLSNLIDKRCVDSPETALAKERLRECVMWADKSIDLHSVRYGTYY